MHPQVQTSVRRRQECRTNSRVTPQDSYTTTGYRDSQIAISESLFVPAHTRTKGGCSRLQHSPPPTHTRGETPVADTPWIQDYTESSAGSARISFLLNSFFPIQPEKRKEERKGRESSAGPRYVSIYTEEERVPPYIWISNRKMSSSITQVTISPDCTVA